MVHGSAAGANYFQYAANAPYIAIDPDGNWGQIVAGAIIGGIVGAVVEIVSRGGINSKGDAMAVLWASVKGAGTGAATGAANEYLGPVAAIFIGAAVNTSFSQIEMGYQSGGSSRKATVAGGLIAVLATGDPGMWQVGATIGAVATNATNKEFHKQSAITYGTSAASGSVGYGVNSAGGNIAAQLVASWSANTGLALSNQAMFTDEGLTKENWDATIAESSKSWAVSTAVSLVGSEIAGAGARGGGASQGLMADPLDAGISASSGEGLFGSNETWSEIGMYEELRSIGAETLLESHLQGGRSIFSFEVNVNRHVDRQSGQHTLFTEVDVLGMRCRDTNDIYLKQNLSNKEAAATFMHEWIHTQGGDEVAAWGATALAMKRLGLERLGSFEASRAFHSDGTLNFSRIDRALRQSSNPDYNPSSPWRRGSSSPMGVDRRFADWY